MTKNSVKNDLNDIVHIDLTTSESESTNSDIDEIVQQTPVKKVINFSEDFIPLSRDSPDRELSEYNGISHYNVKNKNIQNNQGAGPTVHLSTYNGPYSYNCILKARKCLIDDLYRPKDGYSVTNRQLEIAKIKLNIPSKFDGDKRLRRRIDFKQEKFKQEKVERYETIVNRVKKIQPQANNAFQHIKFQDSDNEEEFEDYKTRYCDLRLKRKALLRKHNKNPNDKEIKEQQAAVFMEMKNIRRDLKKLRKMGRKTKAKKKKKQFDKFKLSSNKKKRKNQ